MSSNFELRAPELVDLVDVISMWNPWAWLVVYDAKDVENRTWPLPRRLRGKEFYIHASLREDVMSFTQAQVMLVQLGLPNRIPYGTELKWGGIIGKARVVEELPPSPNGVARADWHMPDQWGWRLEDRTPVPFVPMRGRQRFWRVPRSAIG